MRFNHKYEYRSLLILLSLMLLSACASAPPKVSNIEERATARWNALLSGDLAAAYNYLTPGYRSSVSSIQYQRSILLQRVHWISAQYLGSECTEDTCDVSILLGYKVAGAVPGVKSFEGKQNIHETWILVDGLWYRVVE